MGRGAPPAAPPWRPRPWDGDSTDPARAAGGSGDSVHYGSSERLPVRFRDTSHAARKLLRRTRCPHGVAMPRVAFDALPDHARVFAFAAERALAPDEQAGLLTDVDAFLDGWAAHGVPLRC